MKQSPFTLIYQPEGEVDKIGRTANSRKSKRRRTIIDDRVDEARKSAPGVVKALNSVNRNLSRTLIASTYAQQTIEPNLRVTEKLKRVLTELKQCPDGLTVGIWDLDAKVGGLSDLVAALNKAQPVFTFFELYAPVPAGMVIHSDDFKQWALERFDWRVTKKNEKEFQNNLLFDDFYGFSRVVREHVGVDYLIGITEQMVAWQEAGKVYWNYFSTYNRRVILTSAYKIAEYAKRAGRPMESAVTAIGIAQLLQLLNKKLSYHENRGCLYDMNEVRESIVETIKQTKIEPQCLALIDEKYREAAEKMVKALGDYSVKPVEAEMHSKTVKGDKGQDDRYWLRQLINLSKEAKAKGTTG